MFALLKNSRVREQMMKMGQAFQASGLDMANMKVRRTVNATQPHD